MFDTKDTTLTPLDFVNRFGHFDFDPCGYPGHKTADVVSTLPTDGLGIAWRGRVWLNPPYSAPEPWVRRLSEHNDGVALVLASTDTAWFHNWVASKCSAVLFIKGRPKFLRVDGTPVGLMRASCAVAYGVENAKALEHAGIPGWFVRA